MISNIVRFWSYVIFLIPSILCSIFILYHLIFDRTLRQSLNNYVIMIILLVILICEVTIYPWMLYYYHYNSIWERSLLFCTIWAFLDWSMGTIQASLLAWATIERHILIFHDQWMLTKKKRFFIHYLPPIILLIYYLIFYITVFFFPSCENFYDIFSAVCVTPCLILLNYNFSVFDAIVHQILPILIIVICSITLLIRVLWQKYRVNQPIQWRKFRKMTIQLLSISLLYIIFFAPFALIYTIYICGGRSERLSYVFDYATYLVYFLFPLFSFVCVLTLPEIRTKFVKFFSRHRQTRRVGVRGLT